MKKITHITITILTAIIFLTGCTDKEAQKKALEESQKAAIQDKEARKKALEESQKAAIQEAISYDKTITKQTGSRASLGEAFFGLSDEKKADYVRNLKRVPLDACPADFKEAYQRHIAAWDSRSHSAIESTWADVLAIAGLHGVYWK